MIPNKVFSFCIAIFFFFTVPGFAVDPSPVETQMRQLLKDKIIGLRMPYTSSDLKYDANGQLVGTSDLGPWTTFGSVQVNDVAVKDSSFEIDGERVILVVPSSNAAPFTPMLSGRKVHLTLALTAPADENSIKGALGNIFSGTSVEDHFASYWKPSVDHLLDLDKPCKSVLKDHPDGVVATLTTGSANPVYACVKNNIVSKPKGITTPAPGADTKKPPQGSANIRVIIDENGYPAIIKAKSSSNGNYGLAALSAVAQWKYSPAMKDGKAVPYMMDVELGQAVTATPDQD